MKKNIWMIILLPNIICFFLSFFIEQYFKEACIHFSLLCMYTYLFCPTEILEKFKNILLRFWGLSVAIFLIFYILDTYILVGRDKINSTTMVCGAYVSFILYFLDDINRQKIKKIFCNTTRELKIIYCQKKKISKVTAYNLSEGHYDSEGNLLFDCYEDGIPTIIINEKNSHKAFQDCFVVNDGKYRWFVQTDIFNESYKQINGNDYESRHLVKEAYDLSISHYDNDGNLLFDGYTSEGNPILSTLESEYYVCDKDGFIIIGVLGEKYHCSRRNFFENYNIFLPQKKNVKWWFVHPN